MKSEITKRFKAIRVAENISTQKEFAKHPNLAGWPFYEAGKRLPGWEGLVTIMEMGYNINWLLSGKGEMFLNDKESPFNQEVMEEIIIAVEEFLLANKKVMKPTKKAELICVLHNHFVKETSETFDHNSVMQLIKVSAA